MTTLADLAESNTGRGLIYALEDIAKQLAAANAIAFIALRHSGCPVPPVDSVALHGLIGSALGEYIPTTGAAPAAPEVQPEASKP